MANLITRGLSDIKQTLVILGLLKSKLVKAFPAGPYGPEVFRYLKRRDYDQVLLITGIKGFNINKKVETIGTRSFNLSNKYNIKGIKESKFKFEQIIEGIKEFTIEENKLVGGIRQTSLIEDIQLNGVKETNLNEIKEINGQKDITNILVSLDII